MNTETLHLHYATRAEAETQAPVDFLAHCESQHVEMRSQPTFAQVGEEWIASALVTSRAPNPVVTVPTTDTETEEV